MHTEQRRCSSGVGWIAAIPWQVHKPVSPQQADQVQCLSLAYLSPVHLASFCSPPLHAQRENTQAVSLNEVYSQAKQGNGWKSSKPVERSMTAQQDQSCLFKDQCSRRKVEGKR